MRLVIRPTDEEDYEPPVDPNSSKHPDYWAKREQERAARKALHRSIKELANEDRRQHYDRF
jgi:hypothetical protein